MSKQEIKNILQKQGELYRKYRVKSLALFGSYVRDEAGQDSDVDLLVEFEEQTYHNFINLIFDLEAILQKKVTVVSQADLSPYIRPYVLKEAEFIEG